MSSDASDRTTERPAGWAIRTSLDRGAILDAFESRARRGKLAEYAPGPLGRHGGDFSVDAPAMPFDHRLVGTFHEPIEEASGESAGSTRIRLELVRLQKTPLIFAVVLALTVWPGSWLTDSMLSTYFAFYSRWTQSMPWLTYAWYLPLTALPLPWMWRGFVRKSRAEAEASGAEMAEDVRAAVHGTLERLGS